MKNVIRIENKDLEIKEWNGERVVTVYDISNLHNKEVKRINENFKNNKDRFKIGKDYFEITTEEMRQSDLTTALSKYSNHKVEKLFTERGYLKLTKTFNDELSWKIQDLLVESYFVVKNNLDKIELPKTYLEALKELVIKEEEKQRLLKENEYKQQLIEEQKPKVDFVDNVLISENVVTTTIIAKQYGMSARAFNKLLNELGVQYKVGGVWVLYSKYENKGYTKVITSLDNKGEARELTKWTQKGREFLYRLLRDNDIVPLNEEV